ncbi:hypothetical protein ACP4OV_010692 [Aristida adscensionis]
MCSREGPPRCIQRGDACSSALPRRRVRQTRWSSGGVTGVASDRVARWNDKSLGLHRL